MVEIVLEPLENLLEAEKIYFRKLGKKTEKNFLFLNYVIGSAEFKHFRTDLEMIIDVFFIYINQLGITEQELEQAYYDKNKINYERLENGY